MKTVSKFICTVGLVGMAATASAQQYYYPGDANAVIPDGDVNGITLLNNVQNAPTTEPNKIDINAFRIYLNLVGDPVGGIGDLEIYLSAPDGNTVAQLLNRAGLTGTNPLGYQDSYMNVTFFDGVDPNATRMDVHYYQNDPFYTSGDYMGVTGVFKTDGRYIDPLSSGTAFDAATRDNTLAVFQGINPNGEWALFAADVSSGGNSLIKEWGIDFSPIPEPQSYAMAIGAGLIAFALYRRRTLKVA